MYHVVAVIQLDTKSQVASLFLAQSVYDLWYASVSCIHVLVTLPAYLYLITAMHYFIIGRHLTLKLIAIYSLHSPIFNFVVI